MEKEPLSQPPTDIAGVGIHLQYIMRDMKSMNSKLDALASNFVPISVHLEYRADVEKRLKDLETAASARKEFEDKWSGRVWGINSTIGFVIGAFIFLLDHFWKR